MKFRFSDSMLLELALQQLKTNKVDYEKQLYHKLRLQQAKFIKVERVNSDKTMPNTDVKLYADDHIYTTPTHNIKCTKYGRIKQVEAKQRVAFNRPERPRQPVVVHKKRKIVRTNEIK